MIDEMIVILTNRQNCSLFLTVPQRTLSLAHKAISEFNDSSLLVKTEKMLQQYMDMDRIEWRDNKATLSPII